MVEQTLTDVWSFNLDPAFDHSISITFRFVDDATPYEMSTKQYYTYRSVEELPAPAE